MAHGKPAHLLAGLMLALPALLSGVSVRAAVRLYSSMPTWALQMCLAGTACMLLLVL